MAHPFLRSVRGGSANPLGRRSFLFATASLLGSSLEGESAPVSQAADFRAYVQASYRFRSDLEGWESTARILAARFGGNGPTGPGVLVDRPPAELTRLLTTPPGSADAVRILYLGLHVNASGEMIFGDGSKLTPGQIADQAVATKLPLWKPDVVVVDTCHAASFAYDRPWVQTFACPHFFASETNELAWELDVNLRQPIHLGAVYPEVKERLQAILGPSWKGSISDLGFRAAKQWESETAAAPAMDFLKAVSTVQREDVVSTRFRQSSLLWVEPERLMEVAR